MSNRVCFIDTETLGLDPDYHAVWEVGMILGDDEYQWQVEVTPRERSLAHPIALDIGRFDERYNIEREPIPPGELAFNLWNLIPDGTHLAGAVVSFDEERLRRLLWRFDLSVPWHYHLVDVEALAAGRIGVCPPWDSEKLSRAVGVEPDTFSRHTALGDARWAKAVYEAVLSDNAHFDDFDRDESSRLGAERPGDAQRDETEQHAPP